MQCISKRHQILSVLDTFSNIYRSISQIVLQLLFFNMLEFTIFSETFITYIYSRMDNKLKKNNNFTTYQTNLETLLKLHRFLNVIYLYNVSMRFSQNRKSIYENNKISSKSLCLLRMYFTI